MMKIRYEWWDGLTEIQKRSIQRVLECKTLAECTEIVNAIAGLIAYRGGSHVAVHQERGGKIVELRLAIITEG